MAEEESPLTRALKSKKDWTVYAYGGVPLSESMNEAKGTGANAGNFYPKVNTDPRQLLGGRLQLTSKDLPYLALALDAWKNHSDMGLPNGYRFKQDLLNLSPSVQGRYPTEYGTPYAGIGPVLTQVDQYDKGGHAPATPEVGFQVYGGYEKALSDKLKAMAELRYHRSHVDPPDPQGAFDATYNNLSAIFGLGYTFGGSSP